MAESYKPVPEAQITELEVFLLTLMVVRRTSCI